MNIIRYLGCTQVPISYYYYTPQLNPIYIHYQRMGNSSSSNDTNDKDYGSSLRESFDYCVAKNTLNLNGSRGAYGDIQTALCIIDRQFDKTWAKGVSDIDSSSSSNSDNNSGNSNNNSNFRDRQRGVDLR